MRKQDWIALLPIFILIITLISIFIMIPLVSLFLEVNFSSYRQDTILITREDDVESITEPIGNLTAADLSSVPKLLSALQKMVQDETEDQLDVKISVKERDTIVQLFEELNLPLSDIYPRYVYFENILFEIILTEDV